MAKRTFAKSIGLIKLDYGVAPKQAELPFPGAKSTVADNGDGTIIDNLTGLMWDQTGIAFGRKR